MAVKIAFFSQKGGVGKSTSVLSITPEIAGQLDSRPLVIDSEIGGGTSEAIRLYEMGNGDRWPADLIPLAEESVDKDPIAAAREVLVSEKDRDVIVIDGRANALETELGRYLSLATDLIVVPIRPGVIEAKKVVQTHHALHKLFNEELVPRGIEPPKIVGMWVLPTPSTLTKSALERISVTEMLLENHTSITFLENRLYGYEPVLNILSTGVPIGQQAPGSKAHKLVRDLADEILDFVSESGA